MSLSRAKLIIVFCLGFFTLFAQALLFRDFLEVFEGNELSVGLFFFSWLIWVAFGAFFARLKFVSESRFSQNNYEFLFLLCIPAFILQEYLLLNASYFVGAAAFERISFGKLIPAALLFNAPISFLSGFLFVSGCKWMEEFAIPVARVYIWECAGSFVGALSITLLLYFGLDGQTVFAMAAVFVATAVFVFLIFAKCRNYVKLALSLALSLIFLAGLFSGMDKKISEWKNYRKWKKIMPDDYIGAFSTAQAQYLYGLYKKSIVVLAWGEVLESPGYLNASGELAANFAEKPDAKNILVISPGALFFCGELARLKQVERLVWLDPDPEYPEKLLAAIGDKIKINTDKIDMPEKELRSFLNDKKASFDLIILRLSDPSSLALNRYFTLENFALLKKALKQKGVLSVSFPGGENFMGPELSYFGSSLLFTLRKEFKNIVLKPGDGSVFFACDSDGVVSDDGRLLQSRLEKVDGISSMYPPENIVSSFLPERIKFQMGAYANVIENSRADMLVNSDSDPKSFLYGLLSSVKRLGSFSVGIPLVDKANILLLPLFFCFILFCLLFRGTFIFHLRGLSPNGKRLDLFESLLIVFAASFAGMLLNIILIFNYQIQFGSLFLYFGLVVSLFMLGLFAGGWLMDFLLEKKRVYCRSVSFLTLLLGAFVFVFCLNPAHSQIYFAFLFFSSGFFLGIYVPFSAYQMKRLSIADRKASSLLDSLDHLAGAMGGLLSCVVFLPVLGEGRSFAVIFSLLAAICVMTFFFSRNDEESNKPGFLSAFLWIVAWALFLAFSFFLVWHSYVPGGKREAVSGGSEANSSANIQKLIRNGKLSSHEAMDFSE